MESQENWSNKPSQTKQRGGKSAKTYRRKNYDADYSDAKIDKMSKKPILSEKRRRFKQDIKRAIDYDDYEQLEDLY